MIIFRNGCVPSSDCPYEMNAYANSINRALLNSIYFAWSSKCKFLKLRESLTSNNIFKVCRPSTIQNHRAKILLTTIALIFGYSLGTKRCDTSIIFRVIFNLHEISFQEPLSVTTTPFPGESFLKENRVPDESGDWPEASHVAWGQ